MKALIVYFSGTGNTKMITEEIAVRLKKQGWDTEVVSIEMFHNDSRDFNFNLRTMDLLGFGFPVYKFHYPDIMEQIFPFLTKLKPSLKPFFVFSTYARFESKAIYRFTLKMESLETAEPERPHCPVATRAFKCPSNGIASLKDPESRQYRDVMYFESDIVNKLNEFTVDVLSGYERYFKDRVGDRSHGSPDKRWREHLVGRIEQMRYPLLSVDPELCIGCGLCVKHCPEDNLIMENEIAAPIDKTGCLHCLRCLHICPKKAISFGPLVNGPSRYTPKVRKMLFSTAASRSAETPEPGTRFVRLRWAIGNIIYFFRKTLFHRELS